MDIDLMKVLSVRLTENLTRSFLNTMKKQGHHRLDQDVDHYSVRNTLYPLVFEYLNQDDAISLEVKAECFEQSNINTFEYSFQKLLDGFDVWQNKISQEQEVIQKTYAKNIKTQISINTDDYDVFDAMVQLESSKIKNEMLQRHLNNVYATCSLDDTQAFLKNLSNHIIKESQLLINLTQDEITIEVDAERVLSQREHNNERSTKTFVQKS